MASFVDDDSPVAVGGGDSTHPFDDGYAGYDPRLSSQRFEYSPGFDADSPAVFNAPQSFGSGDEVLVGSGGFSPEQNGEYFRASDGPILPPPSELQTEEGFALREWRRLNAIKLEEKEKREKQVLVQIIEEAEQFKVEFYQKRSVAVENNKNSNHEKEKLFLASRDKFHSEAEKNYWKAIGELIPHEVPTIEKRGKKDKEKKPLIVVIQGPKPGKPTDLSRMRQVLLKLKHNTPEHMKPKPPPATEPKKDAKPGEPATGSPTPPPPAAAAKEVSASA